MSECHDDGGAVPGHRTPSIGLPPSIYTSNSQGKALTKTGQEPNGIKLGKAKKGGYSKFRYLQFNNFTISTPFRA
jgi:hypothetical protein